MTAPPQSDRTRLRRLAFELVLASFIVLFQELALIRWLPGQVRVLAYFPNLILTSAFLGLGIGCLRAGKRSLLWLWPAALLFLTVCGWALGKIVFTQESTSEHLWLLYHDLPKTAAIVKGVRLPIMACFMLSMVSFVSLGQIVAERIQAFKAGSVPLSGYCWDILGSLLGVAVFGLVGFSGFSPVLWFSVFLLAGVLFFTGRKGVFFLYVACCAAVLFVIVQSERYSQYSPYYAISLKRNDLRSSISVLTNGSLHQVALPVGREERGATEEDRRIARGYHFPYRFLKKPPRKALVVGAGTGNDVAVLLAEGAERIDAVEIDPRILDVGRRFHPDRPYDSPRVRVFNTDARSFLSRTEGSYDLIVFGTLDSMTRLSALSNVRLDNFVYTVDALKAARSKLTSDGGLVMYFMVSAPFVDQRLTGMLAETFGELPAIHLDFYGLFNRVLMAGPAFSHVMARERAEANRAYFSEIHPAVQLPTDDWPYLYLKEKSINGFYASIMAFILLLSLTGVLWASREMRESLSSRQKIDWEMFLFGLGFLLLETRSVTAMNLVWGATWLTSMVVFGSILIMVLAATLLSRFRPPSWGTAMGGLIASLVLTYFLPLDHLLDTGTAWKFATSVPFIGAPIFFASLCFACLFKEREEAGTAFGWNLLGAVVGGLLEFLSMSLGLKALILLALLAYLAAALKRSEGLPVLKNTAG
jgi:spermidine synthase